MSPIDPNSRRSCASPSALMNGVPQVDKNMGCQLGAIVEPEPLGAWRDQIREEPRRCLHVAHLINAGRHHVLLLRFSTRFLHLEPPTGMSL